MRQGVSDLAFVRGCGIIISKNHEIGSSALRYSRASQS